MAYPLSQTTLYNDADLVAYYPLDGDSTDPISGYNGSDNNISYSTSYGTFDQGAKFTRSSSSYINLGVPAGLQFSTGYTVMGWMRITGSVTGGQILWGKWDTVGSVNTRTQSIYIAGTNLYQDHSSTGVSSTSAITSTTTISTNTWYMITTTWDGSKIHMYINASEEGTGANETGIKSSPACRWGLGAWLGRVGDPSANSYDFQLDDVAFFSSALTSTEIADHYNGNDYSPSSAMKDILEPGIIKFPR